MAPRQQGGFHGLHGRAGAEALFDVAKELMRVIGQEADARKERRRVERNAKARARYAERKRNGTLPEPVRPVSSAQEYDPGCQCATCGRPPCSWCESGGDGEEG